MGRRRRRPPDRLLPGPKSETPQKSQIPTQKTSTPLPRPPRCELASHLAYTLRPAPYSLHTNPCALQPSPYTRNSTHSSKAVALKQVMTGSDYMSVRWSGMFKPELYPPHPAPCTLHPTYCMLHVHSGAEHPTPHTLHTTHHILQAVCYMLKPKNS